MAKDFGPFFSRAGQRTNEVFKTMEKEDKIFSGMGEGAKFLPEIFSKSDQVFSKKFDEFRL